MSRVGKNPITIPEGVTVDMMLSEGVLKAKGALGELTLKVHNDVAIAIDNGSVHVSPKGNSQTARAMWGTTRSLVSNLVEGVHKGFDINLEIVGVGYCAAVQGQDLVLQLGFSHEVKYAIPQGLSITCEKPTSIKITGADRQLVGQTAAEIRSYRPPEPYKGKGIKYAGERLLRKEGKKK